MKEQTWVVLARSRATKSALLALVLFGFAGLTGWANCQVVTSTQNPLQIALLHWYPANLTTQFSVGNGPNGIAFDGTNIWVTNGLSNTVTKLREAMAQL